MSLILNGTTGISDVDGTAAAPALTGTDTNTGIFFPAADTIAFAEGGVEAARLDSAGNMGLGATPSAWYTGYTASQVGVNGSVWANRTTADTNIVGVGSNQFLNSGATNRLYISNGFATRYEQSSGTHAWYNAASGTAGNAISFTQAMTLDASGRLLVGTTSPIGSTFSTIEYSATTYNGIALNQSTNSGGGRFMLFASQGTQCGVIDRVGTTSAVVYTTTSDRRLKENIVDAPSAIAHINAVKVRSFNWIDGGHQVKYGVIAQEFVEVEPDAVVQGDNGQTIEKSWAVDTAALVPAMIKAIQEQQALITALTTRITALEGAA